jgi:glycosyltransferase involved in cell wall biosynthesis
LKIVYFYQYFSTPNGSWGTRVYEFAKNWVEQGHEVTIVSSIYSKSDLKAEKLVEDQYFDGIHVKVFNILIDNKHPKLFRLWTFLQYCFLSSWYALTLPADVVIASSGPITVGVPGLVARYFRGRKLIFETRDLWPEGAIQLGIIRNPLIKKFAYWLEKKCYLASSHIITLSPGMKDDINSRFGIKSITSVTNAANLELFATPSCSNLPDYLKNISYAIYTGNIGPVNNSRWLLDTARILKNKNRTDVAILLIGEGTWKKELEEVAKSEQLSHFIIHDLVPKYELVSFVQKAMVSLVPLKGIPVLNTSSPNKLFESLAAGVPIVQNTSGWMKDFLEENEVGFTIASDDSEALAELLVRLKDDPERVKEISSRCFQVAKKYFDKNHLAGKMLKVLEGVVDGKELLNAYPLKGEADNFSFLKNGSLKDEKK